MNERGDRTVNGLPRAEESKVAVDHALMRAGIVMLDKTEVRKRSRLTARQEQIRTLLRVGMSNKLIAAELGITEGTVKNHITDIFKILKTNNRTQAARDEGVEWSNARRHPRELTNTMYDLEEYLHLALHANAKRDPHACIGYLKEALRAEPQSSRAIYLLAIQHAEIGLVDRGIAGLTKVLTLEPAFEIARLQLSLLLLDRNRTTDARAELSASRASADPAVREFAEGMILAIDGRIAEAVDKLKARLELSAGHGALRMLTQEVVAKLEKMKAGGLRGSASGAADGDRRIFMGAYESPSPSR
jgi:DNA-binding CsgD family transcriptional regulator